MREGSPGEGYPAGYKAGTWLLSTKLVKMYIRNKLTGQSFELSRKFARVRHTQRRVHAWATALDPLLRERGTKYRLVMARLSYRPGDDWRANDVREFCLKVRDELGKSLKAYAWVAELQERGAVHYHVLMLVDRGTRIPFFDKAGWWVHGSTRIETAVRTIFYICSYTAKEGYQKFGNFPKGLRMFAVWIGDDVIDAGTRWKFRLSAFPAWLAKKIQPLGRSFKVKRNDGGGWLVDDFLFESPYECIFT